MPSFSRKSSKLAKPVCLGAGETMEFPQTADFNGTPGKHNRQGRELTFSQRIMAGAVLSVPTGVVAGLALDTFGAKEVDAKQICVLWSHPPYTDENCIGWVDDGTGTGGGGGGGGGGGNTVPAPTQPSWNELIAKFCEGIPNRDDLANDLQNNSGGGGSGRMVTYVRECDITFNADVDPNLGRPLTNLELAIADKANNMTPSDAQLAWLNGYITNVLLPTWYSEHPDLAPTTTERIIVDEDGDGAVGGYYDVVYDYNGVEISRTFVPCDPTADVCDLDDNSKASTDGPSQMNEVLDRHGVDISTLPEELQNQINEVAKQVAPEDFEKWLEMIFSQSGVEFPGVVISTEVPTTTIVDSESSLPTTSVAQEVGELVSKGDSSNSLLYLGLGVFGLAGAGTGLGIGLRKRHLRNIREIKLPNGEKLDLAPSASENNSNSLRPTRQPAHSGSHHLSGGPFKK